MKISDKEFEDLVTNKASLLLRNTYPVRINSANFPIYFVKLKSGDSVVARATCSFVMYTKGYSTELAKANITREEFSSKFTKLIHYPDCTIKEAVAIAWEISNFSLISLKLSDFFQYLSHENTIRPLVSVSTGWTYILCNAVLSNS